MVRLGALLARMAVWNRKFGATQGPLLAPLGEGTEGELREGTEGELGEGQYHDFKEPEALAMPRVARDPGLPSAAAREAHDTAHLPFRVWCPHCVAGRTPNHPHPRLDARASDVPEVAVD